MIDISFLKMLLKVRDPRELHHKILKIPPERLAVSESEEPMPMDTIGQLIDKLITVDMKMWHNQERLYAIRRMTTKEFQSLYGDDLEGLHAIISRCCDLNVQRSRLMDAIDQLHANTISGAQGAVTMAQHKTY